MPSKSTYMAAIDTLWESRRLTNDGFFHKRLEARLRDMAGEGEVSLTANGTLSLFLALKVGGAVAGRKIITTPFTFPATTNVIEWIGCTPVFADIDPMTGNINPDSVARLIDEDTAAVLAVHVYGAPCDHAGLESVCAPASVPIIYDAAHSFASKINGRPVLTRWAARRRRVFTPPSCSRPWKAAPCLFPVRPTRCCATG